MTKFQQIFNALESGASFSWGFDGIENPEQPKDNLQCVCNLSEQGKIGYHVQVFISRALYYENLKITFIQEDGNIKIYY
jgi:hypothetical protein